MRRSPKLFEAKLCHKAICLAGECSLRPLPSSLYFSEYIWSVMDYYQALWSHLISFMSHTSENLCTFLEMKCTPCEINFLKWLPNIEDESSHCIAIVASLWFSFDFSLRKVEMIGKVFLLLQFVSILKSIRRTITETFTQFKVF